MGYATIVSGGTDGRYTIQLDFGEQQRQALLTAITQALQDVGEKITFTQDKIDVLDAAEAEQQERVKEAAEIVASEANFLPPGSPVPDTSIYKFELDALRTLQMRGLPYRINMRALKQARKNLLAKQTQYTSLVTITTRQAWCVDLTENGTGLVATVDIPGESDLILLDAGCRTWAPSDGYFRERDLMSPEQCYYNAAVLPTWQKYKPTYRWGTITHINDTLKTVNLTLFDSTSSAQRIRVNERSSFVDVPVTYMECGSDAFVVGDRVVVKFVDQSWSNPIVIGFVDTPRACPIYTTFNVSRAVVYVQVFFGYGDGTWYFGPGDGVLYHLSGVGFMYSNLSLENGDAYGETVFPESSNHLLLATTKQVGSTITTGTSNNVAGGTIAGANVQIRAQYVYVGPIYYASGVGAGGANIKDIGPPRIWNRAFTVLGYEPKSGEFISPDLFSETAALAWVPSTQSYDFPFAIDVGGTLQTVVIEITFNYVSGGVGAGASSVWNVTWARVA